MGDRTTKSRLSAIKVNEIQFADDVAVCCQPSPCMAEMVKKWYGSGCTGRTGSSGLGHLTIVTRRTLPSPPSLPPFPSPVPPLPPPSLPMSGEGAAVSSLLPIVTSQRERFKQRNAELASIQQLT